MPSTVNLSILQLSIFAVFIVILSAICIIQKLDLGRSLLINAVRCVIQLLLIGSILNYLFETDNPLFILTIVGVMIAIAAHEISQRQQFRANFLWQMMINVGSLFIPAVCVTLFTLLVVLQLADDAPSPWYDARYTIPLLGMILGNSMTGIALGLDRLYGTIRDNEKIILQRLFLGTHPKEVVRPYVRIAMRAALIPTINTMAVTGIVSIPGMMTGQMLAGNSPTLAAKYQIMIMFLIVSCVGFGSLLVTHWFCKHLFDDRMRLRLDRFLKK